MEVSYQKNLNKSYMCVKTEKPVLEAYEMQMLQHCRIPELLKMQTVLSDTDSRYYYDISGKQQIADYLSGKKMGCKMLKDLLLSIQKLCASLPEYLLRESGICLELEFIYINLEHENFQYTYLPFYERSLPEAFCGCMEQLLRKIDHQDHEAVELGYRIYQLCIQDNASIRNILETVFSGRGPQVEEAETIRKGKQEGEKSAGSKRERYAEQEKNDFQTESQEKKNLPGCREPLYSFCANMAKRFFSLAGAGDLFSQGLGRKSRLFLPKKKVCCKDKKGVKKESGPGQIPLLSQVGAAEEPAAHQTELLTVQEDIVIGKLEYRGMRRYEDIFIEGESFLLGKNGAQVDGVIPAKEVSRLHARIIRQEQRYFIEDLNSTNGTFLNDVALEYHQPRELNKNDRVRFGAEEYVFL
ncbi:DUF6382 domain-containing protein [Lachnospiraceae bacterium 45-W7]